MAMLFSPLHRCRTNAWKQEGKVTRGIPYPLPQKTPQDRERH